MNEQKEKKILEDIARIKENINALDRKLNALGKKINELNVTLKNHRATSARNFSALSNDNRGIKATISKILARLRM